MAREGEDAAGGAEADRLLGHAEDHRAGLVLGDGLGAGVEHLAQAAGAVVAHAGHDHAESVRAGAAGTERKSTSTEGRWRLTGGPSRTSTRYCAPLRRSVMWRPPGAMSTRPGITR